MRTDVQNMDLMTLSGFCRNCLSKVHAAHIVSHTAYIESLTAHIVSHAAHIVSHTTHHASTTAHNTNTTADSNHCCTVLLTALQNIQRYSHTALHSRSLHLTAS